MKCCNLTYFVFRLFRRTGCLHHKGRIMDEAHNSLLAKVQVKYLRISIATDIKVTVVWAMTSCSIVDVYFSFRGTYRIPSMCVIQSVRYSVPLAHTDIYQTMPLHILEAVCLPWARSYLVDIITHLRRVRGVSRFDTMLFLSEARFSHDKWVHVTTAWRVLGLRLERRANSSSP